jgi:hypothetical protein
VSVFYEFPKEEIGMRALVISTFALAVALAPASAFAQTPPAQQPPAQQPPAAGGQPPAAQPPATPAAPKLTFTSNAGLLLVQVKPDQTGAFEEMLGKLKGGLAKSDKPELKQQASAWHVYKASEPMAGNALYVVVIDPAVPNAEYQFYELLDKTLTEAERRAPETAEMYKRYAGAISSLNKLNLTPVGGGQ